MANIEVHNPTLNINQRVKLRSGQIAQISDSADHRKSRLVDLLDGSPLIKVKLLEISEVETPILGWCDCIWK